MSANVVIQNTRPNVVIDQATVPVLLTTISKGIKGDKGDTGDTGPAGTTDHLLLQHIGINTHDQIDTALSRLANTSGTNTGDQDLTGLVHTNRSALDLVSGINTGDQDLTGLLHINRVALDAVSGVNTGDQDLSGYATTASLSNHTGLTTTAHGGIVASTDSRLTDARTPLAHIHDPLDVTGTAVITTDSRLSDSRTPTAHATSHLSNGSDPTNMHSFHGVLSRSTISPLPTSITTTTFTLACNVTPMMYYMDGVAVTVSTSKTTVLSGAAGFYYIYWDDASGTLANSTTFPGLYPSSTNVLIASVWWNGTDYGLVNDERHGYDRDPSWHSWAHRSVGTRWSSGLDLLTLTGTGATATMTLGAGEILDEDIVFTIPASASFATPNAYRLIYQTGATSYAFITALSTVPFYRGVNNRPNVVNSTGYVVTEVPPATNRYVNFFVYATTDALCPIYIATETVTNTIAGQGGYTSLANARAVPWPNLSGVAISAEMKPLYRVIVRADGAVQAFTTADDYRSVSSLPQSSGTSSTTASSVSFAPSGNIASTTVQQAIEELDIEKVALLGNNVQLISATGNEVAYTLDYTTNKATSGNDTGLLIKMTDTASPGTSYPLEIRTGAAGATTVATIDNSGNIAGASIQIAGIKKAITTTATNLTLTAAHHTVLVTADATITLPAATSHSGRVYVIKKTYAAGTGVVIDGNASETIDGSLTKTLTAQYESITIQCDGSNWWVI